MYFIYPYARWELAQLIQNQHTRDLIGARNTSHKYNNEDLSRLLYSHLACE